MGWGGVVKERNLILNAQFVPLERCQERIVILINADLRCTGDTGKNFRLTSGEY